MRDWGSEGCPPLGVVVGIQPLPPALASWEPGPPAWWKGLILTDKMVDGGGVYDKENNQIGSLLPYLWEER